MRESKKEEQKTDYINITDDGGIKKRIVKEGLGPLAAEGNEVILSALIRNNEKIKFQPLYGESFVFKTKNDNFLLQTMRVGEKSEFIFREKFADEIDGIFFNKIPKSPEVIIDIELIEIILSKKEISEMNYETKLLKGKQLKEKGVGYFKAKDITSAKILFEGATIFLEAIDKTKEEEAEGVNLYVTTLSNLCNCCKQENEYHSIIDFATKGLKIKEFPKLYYFRAIAYINIDEISLAKKDYEKLKELLGEKNQKDEGLKIISDLIYKKENYFEKKIKKFSKGLFSLNLYEDKSLPTNGTIQNQEANINTDNIKNFITAEIYINEYKIGKKIKIINSIEEINENNKSKCIIKINNKTIPFSYDYIFNEKGKHKIEYFFLQPLTKTDKMFSHCSNLTKIDLSNFDTQNVTDMNNMFNECTSLTNINLTNLNTQNVTSMNGLFYECNSLTNIDLSSFNTQNVKNMTFMFYKCYSLIELNLSNFNTEKVLGTTYMFSECYSLKQINLSNFNTHNVRDMSYMFCNCESLTNLNLSNFSTNYVINTAYMFYGCNSLQELNLSNFNTHNCLKMRAMFSGCRSLTKINLYNLDSKNVRDISYMFYDCNSLANIDLSNFNTQNIPYKNNVFYGCNSLMKKDFLEHFEVDAQEGEPHSEFLKSELLRPLINF